MKKIIMLAAVTFVAYKLFAPIQIDPYLILGALVAIPFLTAAIYGLMKAW